MRIISALRALGLGYLRTEYRKGESSRDCCEMAHPHMRTPARQNGFDDVNAPTVGVHALSKDLTCRVGEELSPVSTRYFLRRPRSKTQHLRYKLSCFKVC